MTNILCLTGPSGVGKTSHSKRLCQLPGFRTPTVVTTRQQRADDGNHYLYIDNEGFSDMVGDSCFLEHDSYQGYQYGTLRADIESPEQWTNTFVLDLTPKGVVQVVDQFPNASVVIILPDDPAWLRFRLRERGTQCLEDIEARETLLSQNLAELETLDGARVYASYSPDTWDRTHAEILSSIGVVIN